MNATQAYAIVKSIWRHHPFFNSGGGAFGYDWHTFHTSDPYACCVFRQCTDILAAGERVS